MKHAAKEANGEKEREVEGKSGGGAVSGGGAFKFGIRVQGGARDRL